MAAIEGQAPQAAKAFVEDILSIAYKSRDLYTGVIVRGDTASEAITDTGVTWNLYAQKVGAAIHGQLIPLEMKSAEGQKGSSRF